MRAQSKSNKALNSTITRLSGAKRPDRVNGKRGKITKDGDLKVKKMRHVGHQNIKTYIYIHFFL